MQKFVSLLRGINVSGQKKIKMADLKLLFQNMGFENVKTYIQSGNVVFDTSVSDKNKIQEKIENGILHKYNFQVSVCVLNKYEMETAFELNPYLLNENIDHKHLGITFLNETPKKVSVKEILLLSEKGGDEFQIIDKYIYLLLPNGAGRTKLTLNLFERKLKTTATSRNWKTMTKLIEMMN
jgi:uncharacterized protein (DUF1697 family)